VCVCVCVCEREREREREREMEGELQNPCAQYRTSNKHSTPAYVGIAAGAGAIHGCSRAPGWVKQDRETDVLSSSRYAVKWAGVLEALAENPLHSFLRLGPNRRFE